jgi:hypothetical protein
MDEKIIAVVENDPAMNCYKDIKDIPEHLAIEISHFFKVYKQLEGKKTYVIETLGKDQAKSIIAKCIENYKDKFDKLNEDNELFLKDILTLKNTEYENVKLNELKNTSKNLNLNDIDIKKTNNIFHYYNNLFHQYKGNAKTVSNFSVDFEYDSTKKQFNEKTEEIEFIPTKKTGKVSIDIHEGFYSDIENGKISFDWRDEASGNTNIKLPENMPKGKYTINEFGEICLISDEEIKEKNMISLDEYNKNVEKLGNTREGFLTITELANKQNKNYEYNNKTNNFLDELTF